MRFLHLIKWIVTDFNRQRCKQRQRILKKFLSFATDAVVNESIDYDVFVAEGAKQPIERSACAMFREVSSKQLKRKKHIMTEFEKMFELVVSQKLQCEKEICDWQDGWKLVCFDIGVCPLNIELCGAEGKTLEEKTYNIKLFLLPGSQCLNGASEIFRNEEEFYRERTMRTMAAESIISSGKFSPTKGPNFCENSSVILQAKIKSVKKVSVDDVNLLHIVLKMQNIEFDAFFEENTLPFAEQGNVISSVFTAIGMLVADKDE